MYNFQKGYDKIYFVERWAGNGFNSSISLSGIPWNKRFIVATRHYDASKCWRDNAVWSFPLMKAARWRSTRSMCVKFGAGQSLLRAVLEQTPTIQDGWVQAPISLGRECPWNPPGLLSPRYARHMEAAEAGNVSLLSWLLSSVLFLSFMFHSFLKMLNAAWKLKLDIFSVVEVKSKF